MSVRGDTNRCEGSAEAVINKKDQSVTIQANLILYGTKATLEIANRIISEINSMYNEVKGKTEIDGESYSVNFKITVQVKSEEEVLEMAASNTDIKNNFIRIEDNKSLGGLGSVSGKNNNSGF